MKDVKNENDGAGPQADRRELEMKITRQFRDWIRAPGTLDEVFGPQMSDFERQNKVRQIMGLELLTRADIPPGEDWDTPEPRVLMSRKERLQRIDETLGITPEDDDDAAAPPEPKQTTPTVKPNDPANPTQT